MELETLSYHRRAGWSVPAFPPLDSERTLVLVFAAPVLVRHPEALSALVAAYPTSCVLGCSTAGEIGGAILRDDSLCAVVLRLSEGALRQVVLQPADDDLAAAAPALARDLAGDDLRAVLLLADAPEADAAALLAALSAALPAVPIVGALAADGQGDDRGWVITRETAVRPRPPRNTPAGGPGDCDSAGPAYRLLVSAVGLYGDALRLGVAVTGGGAEDGALPKEEAASAILGSSAAAAAAAAAALGPGGGPSLTLAFSGAARRLALGPSAEREAEALAAARPEGGALLGCYSHGPVFNDGLLGDGLVVLSLGEGAGRAARRWRP